VANNIINWFLVIIRQVLEMSKDMTFSGDMTMFSNLSSTQKEVITSFLIIISSVFLTEGAMAGGSENNSEPVFPLFSREGNTVS
jgi:hypothetical protein